MCEDSMCKTFLRKMPKTAKVFAEVNTDNC